MKPHLLLLLLSTFFFNNYTSLQEAAEEAKQSRRILPYQYLLGIPILLVGAFSAKYLHSKSSNQLTWENDTQWEEKFFQHNKNYRHS